MDSLKDFFKSLGERISNPLIFSFVIAWLAINWEVPVALLFYKTEELKIDNHTSYIELIKSLRNWWDFLLWPLFIALGYTFIFPFVKSTIVLFNEWLLKEQTNRALNLTKDASVPISILRRERAANNELTKQLREEISKQEQYELEAKSAKEELEKLQKAHNNTSNAFSQWRSYDDIEIISGSWVRTTYDETNKPVNQEIFIVKQIVYQIINQTHKPHIFTIEDYFYSHARSELYFRMVPTPGLAEQHPHEEILTVENKFAAMHGYIDRLSRVNYKKTINNT